MRKLKLPLRVRIARLFWRAVEAMPLVGRRIADWRWERFERGERQRLLKMGPAAYIRERMAMESFRRRVMPPDPLPEDGNVLRSD